MAKKVTYKSKFEEMLSKTPELKRAKYEAVKMRYTLELTYLPDWILPNGIVVEAKGKLDYETRRKMLAVKKNNPGADIRLVFMRASNKIRKGSKTTYGDWATQNGFLWSEGRVPKEWLGNK